MDNKNNFLSRAESYRTFFEKSREIVKKISDSFIYDPTKTDAKVNFYWDKEISNKIYEELQKHRDLTSFSYYSEEWPGKTLEPPLLMIDPIDGSREFLLDIPECVVSMSFIEGWNFSSKKSGAHWMWNFRNGFEVMCLEGKVQSQKGSIEFQGQEVGSLRGLVSRREWEEGKLDTFKRNFNLKPLGSIAYKLSLLSQGFCEYVFSKSNKNIWDIAAGTFLLEAMGYSLYNQHGKVEKFEGSLIKGPMLWCREKDFKQLSEILMHEF